MELSTITNLMDGSESRSPKSKAPPVMAGELECQLAKLNGVAHVQVNPLSGYVLVLFDYQVISHYQVFAVINDIKCLNL